MFLFVSGAFSGKTSVQLPVLLITISLLVGCVLVLGAVVIKMLKRTTKFYQYKPVPMDEE